MSSTAQSTPDADPIIDILPVAEQASARDVRMNGKHIGFIHLRENGHWWGFGCPWPGYKSPQRAARDVVECWRLKGENL